jgi:hypothetical protein
VTEQQPLKIARRRLVILRHAEEITGNVSLTCRYYGISRQCFSAWRRRYDAHSLDGLRDRSHRPQVSFNATRTEVVGKIIYLRQHDHFGPARIAMYLKRYHLTSAITATNPEPSPTVTPASAPARHNG